MRKLLGVLFSFGGWALTALRFASDWIGRTTVLDDASLLGARLKPIAAFVAGQPALGFYLIVGVLIVLGIAMLVPRHWLEGPRAKPSEIWGPLEVITYLTARSAWGDRNRQRFRGGYKRGKHGEWGPKPFASAAEEFQRRAQQPGTPIRAYGCLNGQGQNEPIPHTFWMGHTLRADGAVYGDDRTEAYPRPGHFGGPNPGPSVFYSNVRVESRGVETVWPRMSALAMLKERIRIWRDGDRYLVDEAEPESPPSASTPPVMAEPSPPQPASSSPHYPYRKAVLQMEAPKSSGSGNYRGDLESTECTMVIRNESSVTLKECSVHLIDLGIGDDLRVLDEPLRAKVFTLGPSGKKPIRFIYRDLKDIVSNPPHLLKSSGGDVSLDDGVTYALRLELRSEYEFPTMVTLALKVDREYVTATIESQTV